jgi:hypothetical protein
MAKTRLDSADEAFVSSYRDPDGSVTWGSYDRGLVAWDGVLGRGWVGLVAVAIAAAGIVVLLVWLL